jgi:AcrR family transcriptional regulator
MYSVSLSRSDTEEGIEMATRTDAARAPLSRERVLRAAIDLADSSGLESLSMRKLGQGLGVEAMSLYNHTANKGDILDGMADLVVGEMALASPGADWKASLRRSALSAHQVLERHPWACALMMSPARVRPARMLYMESMLGCLREAGFTAEETDLAYHALDSHIIGSTLWETGYSTGSPDFDGFAGIFLKSLPVDVYPYLAEHVGQHMKAPSADDIGSFEFGLDLILDGLERALDAKRGTPAT